jgi:crossover junction endodeoxyribonuclease RuvC
MRVLGIDPGLLITGYGGLCLENGKCEIIEAGVVRIKPKRPMSTRLQELGAEIEALIKQFKPDVMAIEELYSHYGHPKTAIIMGHARGVILMKAAEAHVPVEPYAATRIKKSLTGNGRASKHQMQLMIRSTLGLNEIPEPPDVADALAVAWCHLQAIQSEEEAVS